MRRVLDPQMIDRYQTMHTPGLSSCLWGKMYSCTLRTKSVRLQFLPLPEGGIRKYWPWRPWRKSKHRWMCEISLKCTSLTEIFIFILRKGKETRQQDGLCWQMPGGYAFEPHAGGGLSRPQAHPTCSSRPRQGYPLGLLSALS